MTASPRRFPPGLLLLAIAGVVVAAIITIVSLLDSDPEPADQAGSDVPATAPAPLEGDCSNLHSGHGGMWNAAMADEMTAADCPFPYEPFLVPMAGGEEDADLAAPFEPRLYDEVYQMFAGLDLGVCQVGKLPEPSADGFVFGFRLAAGPPGCPNLEGDMAVVLREYATRAFRDEAAHASTSERTLVLGRWVVGVEAADTPLGEQVVEGLIGLGATDVNR